jgi:hypothetical protein
MVATGIRGIERMNQKHNSPLVTLSEAKGLATDSFVRCFATLSMTPQRIAA